MRHKILQRLLLTGTVVALASCSSTPRGGDQQTVIAEGSGNTCQEALGQAKLVASDKVVGSFVNSQKSLVSDKYYTESVNEYSGGVVRQYTVLESKGDSPCRVKISAEVYLDKKNIALGPNARTLNLGEVGRFVDKQDEARQTLAALIQRPAMFSARMDRLHVSTDSKGNAQIVLQVSDVSPSEKWFSDLESFLKIQGQRVDFERAKWSDIGKSVLSLIAAPVAVPLGLAPSPFRNQTARGTELVNGEGLVCFKNDPQYESLRCYQTWLAGDAVRQLRSIQLNLVERTNDNVTSTRQIQKGAYQMVAFRASDYTYKSKEMGGKRDFYVVEPTGIPFREYLTVNRQALSEENEFAINVIFTREPQTPTFRPQIPGILPGGSNSSGQRRPSS
ncbi:MAG: hypothetical protein FGM35_07475 [Rhodocyclaceae bacterium]|jgi:hypothetical protein|nr:hypothetical protein [Rhodocyclaceae bacterium]